MLGRDKIGRPLDHAFGPIMLLNKSRRCRANNQPELRFVSRTCQGKKADGRRFDALLPEPAAFPRAGNAPASKIEANAYRS
jgi:hypothetical protein